MILEKHILLLEDILDHWQQALGDDYHGYKNHVYRVVNFCLALQTDDDEETKNKIIIAACFHDLGIWSDQTIDYLPPSTALATAYLTQQGLQHWQAEIELMIDMHHKLVAYQDERYPLVKAFRKTDLNDRYPLAETFRKADLVDVSLGMVKFGLPKACVNSIKALFPDRGFHWRLAQLAWQWFSKNPLSLPPFIKW
jgi:hypothetical protein